MYEAPVEAEERTAAQPSLRARVLAGEVVYGGWCLVPSPFMAEVWSAAGFDWLCIDMQHGLIGYETMLAMLQAVGRRSPVLVRVPWNEPDEIMRPLDAGATGVIVPMVNTAEQAAAAVGACRYAPAGFRSWGPSRVSLGNPDYTPESANDTTLCVIMVETIEAVANVEEIVAVPGIDAILIGPYDLHLSWNGTIDAPGRTPRDRELIERVLSVCADAGIPVATSVGGHDDAIAWRDDGVRMIGVSDLGLVGAAAARTLGALRG
jgi:4-hydroxy-2-oxoheptanedioate aldolase